MSNLNPNEGNTYPLSRWTDWPAEVHAFVEDYLERNDDFPNALVASAATLRRMDIAAAGGNVQNAAGESPDDTEYAPLGGFSASDYALTFLVNESVPDRHVWLVLEGTEPGGGEPETVPLKRVS